MDASETLKFPRAQVAPSPQGLLATILGCYTWEKVPRIPVAALIAILREFGFAEGPARVAISRVVERGLLERPPGQRGYCRLSEQAFSLHDQRLRHYLTYGAEPVSWDGTWTFVLTELSDPSRDVRHVLKTKLQQRGFARLYDGVWVCPGSEAASIASEILRELNPARATIISGKTSTIRGIEGDPLSAFDVELLATEYREFIRKYGPGVSDARKKRGSCTALMRRTQLMNDWRSLARNPVILPTELLPKDWPLPTANKVFAEMYWGLGAPAASELRSLVAAIDDDVASLLDPSRLEM